MAVSEQPRDHGDRTGRCADRSRDIVPQLAAHSYRLTSVAVAAFSSQLLFGLPYHASRTRPSRDITIVSARVPRLTITVVFATPHPSPLGANVTDSRDVSIRTPRPRSRSRSSSVSPPLTTRR